MGHPEGRQWTPQEWNKLRISTRSLDELGASSSEAYQVVAKARPHDAEMKAPRVGPEQSTSGRSAGRTVTPEVWSINSCAYCFYRGKGTPAEQQSNMFWFYGTGDGAHNPYRCQCMLRYLAEGGHRNADPAFVTPLRKCVYLPKYDKDKKGK